MEVLGVVLWILFTELSRRLMQPSATARDLAKYKKKKKTQKRSGGDGGLHPSYPAISASRNSNLV